MFVYRPDYKNTENLLMFRQAIIVFFFQLVYNKFKVKKREKSLNHFV